MNEQPTTTPVPKIGLLITDLDETLIGNNETVADFQRFGRLIKDLRQSDGCRWAIATSRRRKSADETIRSLRHWCGHPDFVISDDVHVYRCSTTEAWIPLLRWNIRLSCEDLLTKLRTRYCLERSARRVRERFPDAKVKSRTDFSIAFRLTTPDQAMLVQNYLRTLLAHWPFCLIELGDTDVTVNFARRAKGDAIGCISRRSGQPSENVFAVGNGVNDVSMIRNPCVGMPACVANADAELVDAVKERNGYCAEQAGLRGVMEAINAWRSHAPAAD